MKIFNLLLFLFVLLFSYNSKGQGIVRGKVTDKNGETQIGAVIYLKSTPSIGTVTDIDGNYSIKLIDATPQTLVISYVGFKAIEINVQVEKNAVVIKDVVLESASGAIKEIQITAKAAKAKNYYMEKVKMNSATTLDYISSETMKKTGDANVTAAISRVSGVSTNGAFITVRGIGDRYVKTCINGSRIPTLDPFTNNIKLDLFPSSLIDNIIITKTMSPDLSGDWAGAYISVETKDYPEQLTVNAETVFGYNPSSTKKDYLTSPSSNTDWLGFDNSLRDHDHNNFNTAKVDFTQYDQLLANGLSEYYSAMGITGWVDNSSTGNTYFKLGLVQLGLLAPALFNDENAFINAKTQYSLGSYKMNAFNVINANVPVTGKSFPNNWNLSTKKAPLNFSQSFSIGNQTNLFGKQLGYIIGFRYGNSVVFDANATSSRAAVAGDNNGNLIPVVSKAEELQISRELNGWSALMSLSYKLNSNNSFSLLFMPNFTGTNSAFTGSDNRDITTRIVTISQFYEQRKQMVYQVKSENYLPKRKIKIETNASYTNGKSSAPDFKNLQYRQDLLPVGFSYLIGNGVGEEIHRYYRYLTDNLFDSRISFELPINNAAELTRKLKFGGSYTYNKKNNNQYDYQVMSSATNFDGNINKFFDLNNFEITNYNDINGVKQSGFNLYYQNNTTDAENTIGNSKISSAFAMTDYALTSILRLSGGLRLEHAEIFTDVFTFDSLGYAANDPRREYRSGLPAANPGKLNKLSYLPSISVIYKIRDDEFTPVNLRANYSKSVARPSIRELSEVAYFDYEYRAFVFGNSDLKMVNINNYDLRAESVFGNGDNLSFSVFYKTFKNHIELVKTAGYTWQNVDKSHVLGIEIEGRKKLTNNFDLSANLTLADSRTEFVRSRLEIGGSGVKQYIPQDTIKRKMFGQAPYVINAILSYHADSIGLNISVSYNLQGKRLVIAADVKEIPDIYEQPRNLFDIKISKTISRHFGASFTIKNLLNEPIVRSYGYADGTQVDYDKFTWGTTYQLGINYKL